jgi:hypothetical protein
MKSCGLTIQAHLPMMENASSNANEGIPRRIGLVQRLVRLRRGPSLASHNNAVSKNWGTDHPSPLSLGNVEFVKRVSDFRITTGNDLDMPTTRTAATTLNRSHAHNRLQNVVASSD